MADTQKRGRAPGTKMTSEHKAALAAGRKEARVVKVYLEALQSIAPKKRGRQRTKDGIHKRLAAISRSLPDATALGRLQLLQEKADLERELSAQGASSEVDLTAARKAFVKVAKSYSARKGIEYSTWRASGGGCRDLTGCWRHARLPLGATSRRRHAHIGRLAADVGNGLARVRRNASRRIGGSGSIGAVVL